MLGVIISKFYNNELCGFCFKHTHAYTYIAEKWKFSSFFITLYPLRLACRWRRPSLSNFNALAATWQQVQLPSSAVMLCAHFVVFTVLIVFTVPALCLHAVFVLLRRIEVYTTTTGWHCFAPTSSDRLGGFKWFNFMRCKWYPEK